MHPNEEKLRTKYQQLDKKCPKCDKNLIQTNCGPWCPNPDCSVTVVANYKK